MRRESIGRRGAERRARRCCLEAARAVCCVIGICTVVFTARAQEPPPVAPPEPVERVDAVYPPEALSARQEATVVLLVSVAADGTVTEATVAESGGEAFDQAAVAAIRQWRFRPARRGNEAVASRIRVPFRFALPEVETQAPQAPPPAPAPSPEPARAAPPSSTVAEPPAADVEEPAMEVQVRGRRPLPPRATSDFVLDREVLTVAPHQDAGSVLGSAPGIYVSSPEGEAVAHQVFLRGFDAEHGQDIEFTLNGWLPLNQASHIHGQGYADLNFIIPEVIRSVRVTEGVYDPRQGDFAVAGSVDFDLGVPERGYHLRSTYGSFGTFRQLAVWAPEGEAEETFGAAVIRRTDGFGMNRGAISGGGIGQYAFTGPAGFKGLVHVAAYGARANLAGVLRVDDVEAGRVGFYDSYPDPSASSQSAFGARTQAGVRLERTTTSGARTGLAAWLGFVDFRGRMNFTGYTQRSQINPTWVGRGDLIEQGNQDLGLGARVLHRTPRIQANSWLSGNVELGLSFRTDWIDQEQNLLQAPQNETWDRRVDASVQASDIGVYADADWRITRYVRVRGGVRADVLYYDLDDALGNFFPAFARETHIVGFRRTALGAAFGPRATLEVNPLPWLDLLASYGEGYRSPQALQLEEGENAPFAKVRAAEGGFRLHPWGERLSLTGAGYATFLSTDLAFDPQDGRLERIGPTSRRGFVAHVLAKPWRWLIGSVSVTYVHATLDEPPPATAEDPAPAFEPGQLLPYVPPVVVRADVGVVRDLMSFGGGELQGRLGAGLTFLSPRPLPYARFADPVALLDLSASARWRWIELGLDVFNVIGREYAATEYSFVSDWHPGEIPSLVPARHFSAAAPRTFLGTLGLHF